MLFTNLYYLSDKQPISLEGELNENNHSLGQLRMGHYKGTANHSA